MSDTKQKVYIPQEEYESLVRADNGTPLTDVFPNGILATFNGDEITIEHGTGIARTPRGWKADVNFYGHGLEDLVEVQNQANDMYNLAFEHQKRTSVFTDEELRRLGLL